MRSLELSTQLGFPPCSFTTYDISPATTMLLNGIDVRTCRWASRPSPCITTTLDIFAYFTQPADRRASATLADSLDAEPAGQR